MILIDCDILVYRVGYGCAGYDFVETIDVLDTTIQKIRDRFPKEGSILCLSNTEKTFRHDVAKTAPYKGNRKAEKPEFYNEIRQYLLEERGAVLSETGYEADDYMGMNTNRKTDIIATIDKDLYMIPAKAHYNFVKDELVKIKRPAYYFWYQMLTGDTADNIVGLKGIGPKKADKILHNLRTKEMRHPVEEEYKREFGDKWQSRFEENGKLLWIKRHPKKEFYHYV